MNKQKTILTVATLLILICGSGCTSVYYKQFGMSVKPPTVYSWFEFRDLRCSMAIDAQPSKTTGALQDSSYQVFLCIWNNEDEKCSDSLQFLIDNVVLRDIGLYIHGKDIHLDSLPWGRNLPCHSCWEFEESVIPDSVDTLSLLLQISYLEHGKLVEADTVVEMYRFEGKVRDVIAY